MDPMELKADEKELVRSSFLFRNAKDETVSGALSDPLARVGSYEKGETVFDSAHFARAVGLVLSGRIRVSGGSAPRYRMRTLSKGDPFGAAAVFSPEEDYATRLTAETRCRVLFLPQALLARLLVEDPAVAENYIVFLSERVRFLNEKIRSLTTPSTGGTLRNYLLKNARREEEGYVLRLAVSYSALADTLNMGRASLYRALDEMEENGLIRREGKRILIPDPEALREFDAR
ncbi:MAG: Crp/Fnr family transcriptional regulator [Clostridia bacterium]|nr:Crp/Fnr family transcriptional regulator [Clostridia bacterium]